MADPRLSLVVCTHNRRRDLERCLRAVGLLDERVEVIVVDSGSQPSCRALVEGHAREFPLLRYVREDEPGLSRARNRGIAEASAGIVAFVDDDAVPRADWAGRVVSAFDADDRIGCVGGACVPVFDGERPRWLSDRLLQFTGITRFGPRAREARSSAEWPFGANIAFRREALPSGEPFAEELGRNGETLLSGEESALIGSVRAAGWKIWLEPRAVVEHTVHVERCESLYYWRRLWWAGVTRARSTEAAVALGLKLVAAVPVRLCLFLLTRDRVYLYRTAETAGFLVERARMRRRPA
ncbi:MAG TPA: glycosyltransferase family 2 protein [Gaiellaceae bacterium]|nr:glycosyltransferase family 2 protein [Gaiellaceae bacterium]